MNYCFDCNLCDDDSCKCSGCEGLLAWHIETMSKYGYHLTKLSLNVRILDKLDSWANIKNSDMIDYLLWKGPASKTQLKKLVVENYGVKRYLKNRKNLSLFFFGN